MDTKIISDKLQTFKNFVIDARLNREDHQEKAIEWCLNKEHSSSLNIGGGIIGDEMGLGKTIVSLGLIISNLKKRTLIVVPTALINQWKSKIENILGIEPLIYHGYQRKNGKKYIEDSFIVLTTYGVVSQYSIKSENIKIIDNTLFDTEWDRIIFDEAHHLRNNTNKHISADLLKSNIKWCLTGTPIQNRVKDIEMLFHIVGFEIKYIKSNIEYLIKHYMLRRKLCDVGLYLPRLKKETIFVDYSSQDEQIICQMLAGDTDLIKDANMKDLYSLYDKKYYSKLCNLLTGNSVLSALLRGRQMCIAPILLKNKIEKLIQQQNLDESYRDIYSYNSKLDVVSEKILQNKNNGNRKIVFSHFIDEIDELYKMIVDTDNDQLYSPENVAIYKGSLNLKERKEVLDDDKVEVLIMQIQTGSEGLNLQQYSEMYMVSPNWNPALEDQAVARCHRQGQQKETKIYRFVMKGDINLDGYIKSMQYDKRQIMEIIEEKKSELTRD